MSFRSLPSPLLFSSKTLSESHVPLSPLPLLLFSSHLYHILNNLTYFLGRPRSIEDGDCQSRITLLEIGEIQIGIKVLRLGANRLLQYRKTALGALTLEIISITTRQKWMIGMSFDCVLINGGNLTKIILLSRE